MLKRFAIYGFIGWCLEIIWTGLTSVKGGSIDLVGHTSVWMFFIYGSAVFIFEPVFKKISDCNVFVRGIVWTELIFLIEFISGLILLLLGIEAWYYDSAFSVWGLIRLDYAPLWFVVGLMFERVHLYLERIGVGRKTEV